MLAVYSIHTGIVNVAFSIDAVVTASSHVHNADVTSQVSSLETSFAVTGVILTFVVPFLFVLQHANIMPVVIHFAGEEQTGPGLGIAALTQKSPVV